MAIISETPIWTVGVYQIEKGDDVLGGGAEAPENKPHIDLAKRTGFLKGKIGTIAEEEE
jgi:hypothetical protein